VKNIFKFIFLYKKTLTNDDMSTFVSVFYYNLAFIPDFRSESAGAARTILHSSCLEKIKQYPGYAHKIACPQAHAKNTINSVPSTVQLE
jgi:hypothetical protein